MALLTTDALTDYVQQNPFAQFLFPPGATVYLFCNSYQFPKDEAEFEKEHRQLLWFTYRNHFQRIHQTHYVTDAGWGCMLRCGQMMLSRALCMRQFGPNSSAISQGLENAKSKMELVSKFLDVPEAEFSIHNIAKKGEMYEKDIGQWFGPTTIAQVLKCLINEKQTSSNVFIHTAMDGMIVEKQVVLDLQEAKLEHESALILLVPVRLGLHELLQSYYPAIKHLLTLKQSIGILGGRPNSARYFIGYHENYLLHLDPHYVQPALLSTDDLSSLTPQSPQKMHLSDLDPSMCFGFYCQDLKELKEFTNAVKMFNKSNSFGAFDVTISDYNFLEDPLLADEEVDQQFAKDVKIAVSDEADDDGFLCVEFEKNDDDIDADM